MAREKNTLVSIAAQTLTLGSVVAGTVIPLGGADDADVVIDIAQITSTVPLAGLKIRVQVSDQEEGDGDDSWRDLDVWDTGTDAATDEALSVGSAIPEGGPYGFVVSSETGFGPDPEWIFVKDADPTKWEWCYCIGNAAGSVSILRPQEHIHSGTTTVLWDKAAKYVRPYSVKGQKRICVVIDNKTQDTGPTYVVRAKVVVAR